MVESVPILSQIKSQKFAGDITAMAIFKPRETSEAKLSIMSKTFACFVSWIGTLLDETSSGEICVKQNNLSLLLD